MGSVKVASLQIDGAETVEGIAEIAAAPWSVEFRSERARDLNTLSELGMGCAKVTKLVVDDPETCEREAQVSADLRIV